MENAAGAEQFSVMKPLGVSVNAGFSGLGNETWFHHKARYVALMTFTHSLRVCNVLTHIFLMLAALSNFYLNFFGMRIS